MRVSLLFKTPLVLSQLGGLKNFFQAEYKYVQATAKISQPSLLD
jgi:hypothetical protein